MTGRCSLVILGDEPLHVSPTRAYRRAIARSAQVRSHTVLEQTVPVDGFCEWQATKDSKQPMPLLAYDAKSECHVRTNYSCIRPPFVTSLSTDWTFLTAGFRISRGAITALRVKNCLSSARTTRKDPKDRPKPINATADTVRSRPIFREAYRKRRCPLTASVAIDGSKFKAVNTRDKNFTRGKVGRRRAQLEESAARYLAQLGTANRAGTVRRAGGQDGPSEGQIGQAGKRDAASGGDGKADAGPTRGSASTPEAHRYVAFEPKAILPPDQYDRVFGIHRGTLAL